MPQVEVTLEGVRKLLDGINPVKASGPDLLPCRVLKDHAQELSTILHFIFNQSLEGGQVPVDWRGAFIHPIFKKGDRSDPSNYRPVSLTSVCCKLMEHILFTATMKHLEEHNILLPTQHGFRAKHSCESQLISTLHGLFYWFDRGTQIDMAILDFSKAFDSVPHTRLLKKLEYYGIRGKTLKWMKNWLIDRYQQVVVDGDKSKPVKLEYASTVWGPHKRLHAQTNKLEDKVEAVQKRAARFVTGDYRPTTSMTDYTTFSPKTQTLQEDITHASSPSHARQKHTEPVISLEPSSSGTHYQTEGAFEAQL
ncbi:hypothetical protein Bbelb_372550 [Branchiostoma belcheri]|nr:hypothetical protein Bbelb_372550 [Branchiostoma belcheri]